MIQPVVAVAVGIHTVDDEYAALVVQNKFNSDTAQMFRSLQQNTSGLSSSALQDLKLASSLTASANTATGNRFNATATASTDFNWRDRRRSSGFRGGYNNYSGGGYNNYSGGGRDFYNKYASRNVP